MYYIGIDIGKNYHEASIVDSSGTQIGKSFRFSSNHKGADRLLSHIANLIPDNDFVFGMEATGHYWYTIYSFLMEHGFTVYVINPIQSDCFRNFYIALPGSFCGELAQNPLYGYQSAVGDFGYGGEAAPILPALGIISDEVKNGADAEIIQKLGMPVA